MVSPLARFIVAVHTRDVLKLLQADAQAAAADRIGPAAKAGNAKEDVAAAFSKPTRTEVYAFDCRRSLLDLFRGALAEVEARGLVGILGATLDRLYVLHQHLLDDAELAAETGRATLDSDIRRKHWDAQAALMRYVQPSEAPPVQMLTYQGIADAINARHPGAKFTKAMVQDHNKRLGDPDVQGGGRTPHQWRSDNPLVQAMIDKPYLSG